MFSRPYSFAWLAADDVRPVISSISIQISLECMPPLYQEFLDVVVSAGLAHGSNFIFITCCGTTTVIDGNRLVTELQPPSFDATKSSTAPSAAALQVKLPVTSTRDSRLMTRIRVSGPAARPARESQCPNRPARRGKPLRSRSYRKWLQNSLGPGAARENGAAAWSFWRTEERRRRVRRGWPPRRLRLDISSWTVGGAAGLGILCARVRSILEECGAGWVGSGRCHDSDAGRPGAGAEGRARAACGAPNISKTLFKAVSARRPGPAAPGGPAGLGRAPRWAGPCYLRSRGVA